MSAVQRPASGTPRDKFAPHARRSARLGSQRWPHANKSLAGDASAGDDASPRMETHAALLAMRQVRTRRRDPFRVSRIISGESGAIRNIEAGPRRLMEEKRTRDRKL